MVVQISHLNPVTLAKPRAYGLGAIRTAPLIPTIVVGTVGSRNGGFLAYSGSGVRSLENDEEILPRKK